MNSLYASMAACICIVALSSFSSAEAAFRNLGLTASSFAFWSCLNLVAVFAYLTDPVYCLYWIPPLALAVILLLRQSPFRLLLPLGVGFLLLAAQIRFHSWYPFVMWHKLSIDFIWGTLWFFVAELLSGDPGGRAKIIAAAYVVSAAASWNLEGTSYIPLCNQFWVALMALSIFEFAECTRRRIGSSASRHFI